MGIEARAGIGEERLSLRRQGAKFRQEDFGERVLGRARGADAAFIGVGVTANPSCGAR